MVPNLAAREQARAEPNWQPFRLCDTSKRLLLGNLPLRHRLNLPPANQLVLRKRLVQVQDCAGMPLRANSVVRPSQRLDVSYHPRAVQEPGTASAQGYQEREDMDAAPGRSTGRRRVALPHT